MHVEGLLCQFVLSYVGSVHSSQFERFSMPHVQMINKLFSLTNQLIGNNAKTSKVNRTGGEGGEERGERERETPGGTDRNTDR